LYRSQAARKAAKMIFSKKIKILDFKIQKTG